MRVCSVSAGRTLNLITTTYFIHIYWFFLFDLDIFIKLRHIKMYLLPQVRNKIISDNQHNLEKLDTVEVHSHGVQWRGIVMFMHSLLWMHQLESCGARLLAPQPRIAPLSFAPTRTGPKNSKFYGPDPGPTRLYFPWTNLASTWK